MRKSESSDSPAKRSRTRSGCTVCRARKVKCDERAPFCLNCERLSLECPGYGSGSGAALRAERSDSVTRDATRPLTTTEAGTKRRRTYRSCKACRACKTRCSGERPVCARCAEKSLDCIYSSGPSPAWVQAISPQSPSGEETERQDEQRLPSLERVPQEPPTILSPQPAEQHYQYHPEEAFSHTETNVSHEAPGRKLPDGVPHSLSWIVSKQLPSKENIRCLVDEYFANVHPLRCYGFIHKPSFMQRLDEGLSGNHTGNALLYTICALGAKFFVLNFSNAVQPLPSKFVLSAGNSWADKAKDLVFADLGEISIENLMASVLLYDHDIRTGSYTSAFMLSATSARMAQALQVNLEHSADVLCTQSSHTISACSKEARRRLMWSCYVMDSWVGSGVDQLTMLDAQDIKIQLPCHSRNFLLQIPCITETMERGKVLDFLFEDMIPDNPSENMGIMAYFIRLVELRKRVLRYVKHLDTAILPWLPNSELSQLAAGFQTWCSTLPTSMHFSSSAIYTRKESLELGALALVWCTYHQTLCDLYRIAMPTLFKIRTPIEFPPEQAEFLQNCQQTCFESAKNVSIVISGAIKHSINMLADTWMCTIAYDSTRVMLYYLTQILDSRQEQTKLLLRDTIPLLHSNVKALRLMIPMFATAEQCYHSASGMLRRAGLDPQSTNDRRAPEGTSHQNDIEGPSIPGSPVQMTPEYVLNPLAIYRMARRTVHEKHAPEESTSPLSSTTSSRKTQPSQQQQQIDYNTRPLPIQRSSISHTQRDEVSYHQVPQYNFDGSQIFTGFEFGGSWQPAGTAMEGAEWGGLPPWAPGVLGAPGADPLLENDLDFQSPFYPQLQQLAPS